MLLYCSILLWKTRLAQNSISNLGNSLSATVSMAMFGSETILLIACWVSHTLLVPATRQLGTYYSLSKWNQDACEDSARQISCCSVMRFLQGFVLRQQPEYNFSGFSVARTKYTEIWACFWSTSSARCKAFKSSFQMIQRILIIL